MSAERERGIRPSPSAERATEIVDFLARHPRESFTVSEIARSLAFNRATCHSVLLALDAADYVHRDDRTKGYALGAALIGVGEAALSGMPVVAEARPEVERLAITTEVECVASVPAGDNMVVVATAGPRDRFGGVLHVGYTYPLCPPFATALVAWSDEPTVKAWLDRAGRLSDEQREHYLTSLDAVRRRGYSVTLEVQDAARFAALTRALRAERDSPSTPAEHHRVSQLLQLEYALPETAELGRHRVERVSVPVFDANRTVAMVLGLAGFSHDMVLDEANAYLPPLFEASNRISSRLGGGP